MDPEEGLALTSHAKYSPPKDEGTNLARELREAFKRHERRTLLVDTCTGTEWTGARLLDHCGRLASGLIKQVNLKPNEVVMTICNHSGEEIAMALSVMLAGGALYGTTPSDGYEELKTLCSIVKPDVFIISSEYHSRAVALRQNVAPGARIVWLDKQQQPAINGHSRPINGHARQNGFTQATNGNFINGSDSAPARANLSDLNQSGDQRKLTKAKKQDDDDDFEDELFFVDNLIKMPADWQLIEDTVYKRINAREHILTYMLTSGSTGRPKVVPSTHEELVHGLYSMISACQNEMHLPASRDDNNNLIEEKRLSPLMPLTADDVVAGDLPLDHGAGFNTMLLALWLGAKIIVMPSYDVDAFWQAVSDYRVSFSISSTTFTYKLFTRLKSLIDSAGFSGDSSATPAAGWNLEAFRYIACCGAKLAFVDLVREVQRQYANIKVVQAYGATEIGFMSMVHVDDSHSHLHATGYLFPGIHAKIVHRDEPTKTLCPPLPTGGGGADGQRGELLVWARSKFKGYRCEPGQESERIFADCHDELGHFYRTGDQANFDPAGRLYIHGRFKDTLFLMEDWKILPVELEDVINEHPLVEMSVVVGVPDPQLPGCHAPKAFVKLFECNSAEARQVALGEPELVKRLEQRDLSFISCHIYDFVAARTAGPKHLRGGVRILDEFPRVGLLNKVDRKQLKLMD